MFASPDQPHAAAAAEAATLDQPPEARVMEFVNSRINFERLPVERYDLQDFKLDRMRELLARLGNPQQSLPAVHIAGTKGKGSTAAMTASVLAAGGYRVGLFTSPHLDAIGERMTINGRLPTADEFREVMEIVPPIVHEMDAPGPSMRPTFFECITAMAWVHFLRRGVELVVLEVGLGGRLDATNVCSPLVTVITSISRDHERLLGRTLGRIAGEKAGIIKPGIPVLSGVTQPEPRDVIRQAAAANDAPLYELDRNLFWSVAEALPESAVNDHQPSHDPLTP
ncbi:MAG: folylpolyglutamate synthase/dihydrofolate synthase family protein, partial [Planctomycetaceae bacterium]